MNIDDERRSTYQKYTTAQNEVKAINNSISDLEANLENANDNMRKKYKEVLKSKQSDLTQATMTLESHYKHLEYLNTPEAQESDGSTAYPPLPDSYKDLSRKALTDDVKVGIIKQFGQSQYQSMPR